MSRTPRKEIVHSNGHARAPQFAAPRAHVGTLVVSGDAPAAARGAARRARRRSPRAAASRPTSCGCSTTTRSPAARPTTWCRCSRSAWASHGPPPVRPLVVYRLEDGKETLVRGLHAREPPAALAQGHHRRRRATPSSTTSSTGAAASRASRRRSSRPRCWSPTSTCGAQTGRNRKPPLYPSPAGRGIEVRYGRCRGRTSRSARSTRSIPALERIFVDVLQLRAGLRGARGPARAGQRPDEPRGDPGERRRLARGAPGQGGVPRLLRGALRRDRPHPRRSAAR